MSGPYPPQGYPQQPGQGGWSGGTPTGGGQTGQYGAPPNYDFPAVGYGGLSGSDQPHWGGQDQGNWHTGPHNPNSWGQPEAPQPPQPGGQPGGPKRKSNAGQITIAIVAAVVIVGGVLAGVLLLNNRHQQQQQQQASPPPAQTTTSAPPAVTTQSQPTDDNSANGTTTLSVTAGECVTAGVVGQQYQVTKKATCGSATSDFILDKTVGTVDGCSVHQYVVVQGAPGTVYCFTLDIASGNCLDNNYLKVPCTGAAFTVIKTEPGPGTADSCRDAAGANHWLPADRNPVQIACIGPPTS